MSWLPWVNRRRERLYDTPLTDAESELLDRNVPARARLTDAQRRRLDGLTQVFLNEKTFEGCGGLEFTEDMALTIASQACLLLVGVDEVDVPYPALDVLRVYPSAYRVPRDEHDGSLVHRGSARLGESSQRGFVVLAWDHVLQGGRNPDDGRNVVLHEFAHQLDQEDGKADGGFIGYPDLIDAMESQNFRGNDILAAAPWKITRIGPRKNVREVREFIWLQMLNQGLRTRAIAVADAHSVYGNGVGGWRTYIPSSSDSPGKIDPKEIIRNAKAGRLMLTTGPYLEVTANGVIAGSEIPASSGKVKLKVKVQCTDWVDIDRVQVLVNGRQAPEYNFTRKSHPGFFGNGIVKFERDLDLKLKSDAHLVVVAMGEEHNLRGGYGTSTNSQLRPCAYINPIWVDVDGKGFQPNGDTLDWPLPVRKPSAEKLEAMLEARKKS